MAPAFRIGLTGSIGMGKSTTAEMFAEAGVAVWDADAAVHRLYQPGAAGAEAIRGLVPEAVTEAGVDRDRLRAAIAERPGLLKQVEALIHPLVTFDRSQFYRDAAADVTLADVPLLYETGAADQFDAVVVVTAPAELQRERVLARPGMTEEALQTILARQMPDADKRARADYIVDTSRGLDDARAQVAEILSRVREKMDA